MTYSANITDVQKVRHQARNKNFIEVCFDIVDADGKVVRSQKEGFEPTTTEDEIKAVTQKSADLYAIEQEQAAKQRELDKEDENIASIRDNLVSDRTE